MAKEFGLSCEVHGIDKLRELGMGAFLSVTQGSPEPPALIVLSKPDLFDRCFGVTAYIKQHGYTRVAAFPAFTVWHKPG